MFDLSGYNREQRDAITHGNGPLLILAGAGTGKTSVLTGRLLYLVLEKKLKPSQILALTFTEKATQEMQERIDRGLPLGYEELWVKTFHGFCEAVLRERGVDIGLSPDYRVLTEAEQWMLLKKNIFDFNIDYYRPLGNPDKFIQALVSHFNRLKDEAIAPGAYLTYAREMVEKAQSEEEKMESARLMESAEAYLQYEALLAKHSALDYGGLLLMTLRLFQTRKNVLKKYQEQFLHVLVDEFQDTNFVQNQILLLLTQCHHNLFVVGDDDQSIYKWRGASVANILSFEKYFPRAQKIILSKNYRSPQNILDASYQLIQGNNPNRLEVQHGLSKKLLASSKLKGSIVVRQFDAVSQEVDFVLQTLQKLKKGERDAAILVRTHQHAKPFVQALQAADMPYQYFAMGSIFTRAAVKDLLALTAFLANPADDVSLFRIINLPMFEISGKAIAEVMAEAKRHYHPLFRYLTKIAPYADFEKPVRLMESLLEWAKNHSVSEVLGKFMEESGYGKLLSREESAENIEKLEALAEFSLMVKQFEAGSHGVRMPDFAEYMALLQDAGEAKGVPLEIDREVPKILTLHGAKGLEFETVFLTHLCTGKFPSVRKSDPIEIPEMLIPEPLPQGDHHLEEERRLFYVGMTRSKKNLFLTHSQKYDGPRLWKPSPFLLEVQENHPSKIQKIETNAEKKPTLPSFTSPKLPRLHRSLPSFTVHVDRLSYSQLQDFSTCPLKYKFRYLFRIPSPPGAASNFGTSIHNTLKSFYHALKTHVDDSSLTYVMKAADRSIWLKKLQSFYEENWIPYGYDHAAHEQARKHAGWKMMETFFEKNSTPWIIPHSLERNFKFKMDPIGIEGRIDRIDQLEDGTFEVIDYKTGTSKQKENISHDLQLSLYALACRDVLSLPISRLSFYFLEDNRKISTTRTDAQLDDVKSEVKALAEGMEQSDFSATPGFHCGFCDYRTICDAAMVSA